MTLVAPSPVRCLAIPPRTVTARVRPPTTIRSARQASPAESPLIDGMTAA